MPTITVRIVSFLLTFVTTAAVSADIIRVDPDGSNGPGTTWANAYTNLQGALNVADPGDDIWLADGVYKPNLRTDALYPKSESFSLLPGVEIYGGFQGLSRSGGGETTLSQRDPETYHSILDGDIDNDQVLDSDNAWHVVTADGASIDQNCRLTGVTIRHGYAQDIYINRGGGIFIINEAAPVIARCVIRNNFAGAGGAIGSDVQTAPANAGPQFLSCLITENQGHYTAGAVRISAMDITFVNCVGSYNTVDNDGAFITSDTNTVTMVNCTIVHNGDDKQGTQDANAVRIMGDAVIANCILHSNENPDGFGEDAQIGGTGTITVRCTDIQNLSTFAGNGNIDVDPLLSDPANDDYRPEYVSKVLNHGDPGDLPADAYDIDDDSDTTEKLPDLAMADRQVNPGDCVDLGALEQQTAGSCLGDITDNADGEPDGVVDNSDLLYVIGAWSTPGGVADVSPDPCGDGVVNTGDMLLVIENWGGCSSLTQPTLESIIVELQALAVNHPEHEALILEIINHLLENES